jgi:hypothetical protein
MDDGLVFHKTPRGQEEAGHPGDGLAPKERRCLILIDGTKSVAELAAQFRPGELATILRDLQASGYVEAGGGAA